MQLFERTYQYIFEFQKLLYDTYSQTHVSFLVTYYNIDSTATIWEDQNLLGGPYERLGPLSGTRWNKYLLLPVYFPEEMATTFDGSESGYIKENEGHIVIPSSYGITPYTRDIIKLDQTFLRQTNDTYPIFIVTGVEKTTNTEKAFWRLKVEIEQSRTTNDVDLQVCNTYTYVDYIKKILSIPDALFLTKLMAKNQRLRSNLKQQYDENSGYYFI